MLHRFAPLALWILLLAPPVLAHGVDHRVDHEQALVLRLSYTGGSALAGAAVEIERTSDGETVFEGRTDLNGAVAFLPTEEGPWRCRAFTEDGHGTQFEFDAPLPGATLRGSTPGPRSRAREVGAGLALLTLLFALPWWAAARRRRRSARVLSAPRPSRV